MNPFRFLREYLKDNQTLAPASLSDLREFPAVFGERHQQRRPSKLSFRRSISFRESSSLNSGVRTAWLSHPGAY
jgi:hypothetical protein